MEEEIFSPRVYNFALPQEYVDSFLYWELNSYEVSCPNSSVLLDHTLAVIWHIFKDERVELLNLNRADISWALRFLESIDTKDAGERGDLICLINLMRKVLIKRYSMEDEVSFSNESKHLTDSILPDFDTSSFSMDEYLNCPEVQEDIGKSISIHTMASESKCSKADMLQRLKDLQGNASPPMTLDEAIETLEKEKSWKILIENICETTKAH